MNLKLLRNRNFALLVLGRFISNIGSAMQNFAFSLYVLKLTGSGSHFASILAVGMIPNLILGPICGVFADWFDRKKIIVYLDFISGILIGSMFLISITVGLSTYHIYITVILLSVISSLFNPAMSAALPSVVEKEELLEANSISSLLSTISGLISPVLAGMIFGFYGISVVMFINSLSFILSGISELFIKMKETPNKTSSFSLANFKKDFNEGIKFIYNKSIIRRIIFCGLIMNLTLNPTFSVGVPYIAKMVLKVSDFHLGMLQTIAFIGTMLGPIIAGIISKKISLSKIFSIATLSIGLLIGFMSFNSTHLYISLFNSNLAPYISFTVTALIIYALVTIMNISFFTLIQKEVPLEMMGRVNAVIGTAVMGAIPLGQIIFGYMFDKVSGYLPLMISSVVIITISITFTYLLRRDGREDKVVLDTDGLNL